MIMMCVLLRLFFVKFHYNFIIIIVLEAFGLKYFSDIVEFVTGIKVLSAINTSF